MAYLQFIVTTNCHNIDDITTVIITAWYCIFDLYETCNISRINRTHIVNNEIKRKLLSIDISEFISSTQLGVFIRIEKKMKETAAAALRVIYYLRNKWQDLLIRYKQPHIYYVKTYLKIRRMSHTHTHTHICLDYGTWDTCLSISVVSKEILDKFASLLAVNVKCYYIRCIRCGLKKNSVFLRLGTDKI